MLAVDVRQPQRRFGGFSRATIAFLGLALGRGLGVGFLPGLVLETLLLGELGLESPPGLLLDLTSEGGFAFGLLARRRLRPQPCQLIPLLLAGARFLGCPLLCSLF